MNRLIAFIGFGLLALTGCGPGDGNDPNDTNPDCVGAECENPCEGAECNTGDFEAYISATVPTAGSITLNGAIVPECENIADGCEITVDEAGTYEVGFDCPTHGAIPCELEAQNDGDTLTCAWTTPGSWAALANGSYHDTINDNDHVVSTFIDGDQYLIDVDLPGDWIITVTGHEFSGDDGIGGSITGTISADLNTVAFHVTTGTGNEADYNLELD